MYEHTYEGFKRWIEFLADDNGDDTEINMLQNSLTEALNDDEINIQEYEELKMLMEDAALIEA